MSEPPHRETPSDQIDTDARPTDLQRRARRQGLEAADAALRLWVIRIPCGLFSLVMLFMIVTQWWDPIDTLWHALMFTIFGLPVVLDCANVAFRGRSETLRWMLSGQDRKAKGS